MTTPLTTARWRCAARRAAGRSSAAAYTSVRCSSSATSSIAGDGRRVVLAVLVHRDDPRAVPAGHAGERRGVLAEVARQPDRADDVVGRGQLADGVVGGGRAVVVDEVDLRDAVAAAARRDGSGRSAGRSRRARGQGAGAAVDRDHDGDGVDLGRSPSTRADRTGWPSRPRCGPARPDGAGNVVRWSTAERWSSGSEGTSCHDDGPAAGRGGHPSPLQ